MFLERPLSQRVELGSSVRLNCTVNETLKTSSPVWRLRGSTLTTVQGEIELDQGFLLLPNVTWRHIGEYLCVVTVDGNSSEASAAVNITGKPLIIERRTVYYLLLTGYVKPYVQAEQGVRTIHHNVGEDLTVECPIAGNPGPSIFHWESVDSGQMWVLAAEAACVYIYTQLLTFPPSLGSVTGDTGVETGVFVDEDGNLDVSRVTTAGSQLFDCVGEDAAGNSAGYRIRVISVDPEQGGGLKKQ